MTRERRPSDTWNGESIGPGEKRNIHLAVSQSYSGTTIEIPIHVQRGLSDGPVVFITAALHGDEINGTGAIRNLMRDLSFRIIRGTLILVPVLNILAFERHSRYLPDRRDLNRSFPGNKSGSLASRMARTIFDEIVARSDYGIDLHTAAIRRTNYPTVRGNMADKKVRRIARAFGSEIIIDKIGPKGALRREACLAGCPTIIMEGGEIWKVEPGIVATSVRGIKNVLRSLEMVEGEIESPEYQMVIEKTKWVRADNGGFLRFHMNPGAIVQEGQALVTNTDLLGTELGTIYAPFDAVVVGVTTLPTVSPGEPVCNLGRLPNGVRAEDLLQMRKEEHGLEEQVVDELASNMVVVQRRSEEEE